MRIYFAGVFSLCCSITKSWTTLCDPMDCNMPGSPVLHYLTEFAQTHVHQVGDASNHLILCHPLLLLPSIFPSIRVFSNVGSIPGLGRSPGEGRGYPLQYSGLENSMDCIVHGVAELDTTEQLSLSCCSMCLNLHSKG